MSRIGIPVHSLVLAASLVGMATSTAHAYLDPGTGSMMLQILLGGVAGIALAGKLYWHKFLSLIGLRPKDGSGSETWQAGEQRAGVDPHRD